MSLIIQNRIKRIQSQIKSYERSIDSLDYHFQKRQDSLKRGKRLDARVIHYRHIPYSEERYHSTINNINQQITLLRCELNTLLKYGTLGEINASSGV